MRWKDRNLCKVKFKQNEKKTHFQCMNNAETKAETDN